MRGVCGAETLGAQFMSQPVVSECACAASRQLAECAIVHMNECIQAVHSAVTQQAQRRDKRPPPEAADMVRLIGISE